MRKRSRILLIGIGGVICIMIWQVVRPKELLYRGKRVSDWVEIYCRDGTNARLHFRAVCNLINLGTNSAPYILKMAATHDSVLKKNLLKVPVPDKLLDYVRLKGIYKRWANAAGDRPYMAAHAFLLLGRDKKLAVPGLIELLSNDNPASRVAAADMLHVIGNQAQEAVPALISINLRDPDTRVRTAAAQALIAIRSMESDQPSAWEPTALSANARNVATTRGLLPSQAFRYPGTTSHSP
jgi:hypothetical protein